LPRILTLVRHRFCSVSESEDSHTVYAIGIRSIGCAKAPHRSGRGPSNKSTPRR
jgi:hypothetical protein